MGLFDTLWTNHPSNDEPPLDAPCVDLQGRSNFPNQCAIRMSVALTRSSIQLISYRGAFCWFGHGRVHTIRAEELGAWLNSDSATFVGIAQVRRRPGKTAIAPEEYATRQGIILCRNFWGTNNQGDHIDLWSSGSMAHGQPGYVSRSEEVWFWDLA